MTKEECDNAIRCIKKWSEESPYLQTYKTCLEALEQCQPTDAADHSTKEEPHLDDWADYLQGLPDEAPTCDRNICTSNEYSGIGCNECICNTKDGSCQKEDIEEATPVDDMPCDDLDDELEYKELCIKGLEREKTQYIAMIKMYEDELRKYMSEDDYRTFATKVAKTSFLAEVMASPNEDFRNTVFENWDDITRE